MLAGTVAAVLVLAAGTVALAELLTFVASWLVAPANGVSTAEWFTISGGTAAIGNYLTVLAGIVGWAVFGTTLAVIFRSAPLALGVGFAWAGPFENIVVDSWNTGYRLFPGQVLASLIRGGTVDLAMGRAIVTAMMYVTAARPDRVDARVPPGRDELSRLVGPIGEFVDRPGDGHGVAAPKERRTDPLGLPVEPQAREPYQ